MLTRTIVFIACVLLVSIDAVPQTPVKPEGNLYLRALSACVEKQAQEYKNIGEARDYQNRIVERDILLTEKLPTQIGEYRIEYLDGKELTARYKKSGKRLAILSIRPMVSEDGILRIGLADYWFSYEKRSLTYELEGGCNVFFRYECERKAHVLDRVELWGV